MRKLPGSWMISYRDYIVKQESPAIFHFWVSSQIVSSALRRNIWIDRGAYTVYPNQYVILIAMSGAARKSVAMEIGLDLLNEIKDTMVLHERMTVEGLIDEAQRTLLLPNGKIVPDGSVLIHADELSNLFGKASYITDLMSFLTAGYTSKTKLDFLTRSKKLCRLRNACIGLLAGTTPDQMCEIFPTMTMTSGLLGRIMLVSGYKGTKYPKPELNKSMRGPLIEDLQDISTMYGEMKLTKEADTFFDSWYMTIPDDPPQELASFYERKHDHVLKLAMLISAAESSVLSITKAHLESAITAIDYAEQFIPEALAYIGASMQSSVVDLVFSIIRKSHPERMQHSVLLRKVYRRIKNKSDFGDIIEILHESGRINIEVSRAGRSYGVKQTKKARNEAETSSNTNLKEN